MLNRVKKMNEARSEISKIILLILVRKLKIKQLVTELKKETALRDTKFMRRCYSETVKLSARILKLILHL